VQDLYNFPFAWGTIVITKAISKTGDPLAEYCHLISWGQGLTDFSVGVTL